MYHSNNIEYYYSYRIFTKWSIICIIVTVIKIIYLLFVIKFTFVALDGWPQHMALQTG